MFRNAEIKVPGHHQSGQVERDLPPVYALDQDQVKESVADIGCRTDRNAAADETAVGNGADQETSFLPVPVRGYGQLYAFVMGDCFDQPDKVGRQAPCFSFSLSA